MNYQKLDPALMLALQEASEPAAAMEANATADLTPAVPANVSHSVFIQLTEKLEPGALEVLGTLGVADVSDRRRTYTATLSVEQLAQLSQQPWVQSIKGTQRLNPLGNGT